MKNIFTLLIGLAISIEVFAQTNVPQGINYQAVARDTEGQLVANQGIAIKFSLLDDQSNLVYDETHSTTTNSLGSFTLEIGQGNASTGVFAEIDWSQNDLQLNVELDLAGGTNYTLVSELQLWAVPYALHAQTAENVDDTNELLTGAVLNGSNLEITDAGGTLTVDLSTLSDDADPDPTNELLSSVTLNGTSLELTDAGGVQAVELNSLIDDADADPANELLTEAVLNGTSLELTDAGGTQAVELNSLVDDADPDPTNELLSSATLDGTSLELTDAGGVQAVELNSLIDDADADPANELLTGAVLNGTSLELTDAGGTQAVELSSLVDDADADPANEIQDLSLDGSTLTITNNGSATAINLGPFNGINTDEQELTLTDNDLSISNGNVVDLSALIDDADADDTNELLTGATLNETNLELTDAGGTTVVDLSTVSTPWTPSASGITYNQNVGIGTTLEDASHTLHVEGGTSPTTVLPGSIFTISGGYSLGSLIEVNGGDTDQEGHIGQATVINGTDGINYGVLGLSNGVSTGANRGVYAVATGATNSNRGVNAVATGPSAQNTGVYGNATGATRNYGVRGYATGATDTDYGVIGSAHGTGIYSAGVFAESISSTTARFAYGAFAASNGVGDGDASTTNFGVRAEANNNPNLNYAISASATSAGNINYGIYSEASGATTNYAGYFAGDVRVAGSITGNTNFANDISVNGKAFLADVSVAGNATFSDDVSLGNNLSVGNNLNASGSLGLINSDLSLFIGRNAGNPGSGLEVIAIGDHAGQNNIGQYNIMMGWEAGQHNTGNGNTFIGNLSGKHNTGVDNVFFGDQAGQINESGSSNTYLGKFAGSNNVTGSNNVFLGYSAGGSELGSQKLYIDNSNTSEPLIYGEFDTDVIQLNATVNVRDALLLEPQNSAPASPSKGEMYFDNNDNKLKVWDGTIWQNCF